MPGTFNFGSTFSSDYIISQGRASTGAGTGIDNAALDTMLGADFHFNPDDVSISGVALRAGASVALDVDYGGAGGIDNIDTRLYVIDRFGAIVASVDNSALDVGSASGRDPKLSFTAATTGVYYVVVAHRLNLYLDNTFGFNNGGTDGGDFTLNASFSGLTARTTGTNAVDSVSLAVNQRRYDALGGNDSIYANSFATTIDGGGGDDYLQGGTGADTLFGGSGQDSLYGGVGNDLLVGGAGGDYLSGNAGLDVLFGGSGADSINGDEGADEIFGEDDTDYLNDGLGNDKVYGGEGNDYLYSYAGNDILDGGIGSDYVDLYYASAACRVDLQVVAAQNTGATGIDKIINIEHASGSNFDDRLFGTALDNTLSGRIGNDVLDGRAGADYLYGNEGDDILVGGTAAQIDSDYIDGGLGRDRLTGGGGIDSFSFQTAAHSAGMNFDTISDFSHAQNDRILLYNVYSGTLTFKDGNPFDGANQVRSVDMGNFQIVHVNLDADLATNEMTIRVLTAAPLVTTDFGL